MGVLGRPGVCFIRSFDNSHDGLKNLWLGMTVVLDARGCVQAEGREWAGGVTTDCDEPQGPAALTTPIGRPRGWEGSLYMNARMERMRVTSGTEKHQ
jgi:hypothetical protein